MTGTLSGGNGFGWIMNRQGESLDDVLGTFPTYLDLDTKADRATTLDGYGITDGATKDSLSLEYSETSAYSVGAIVYHDGNIYQCKTAIADGGEAWNATHWEMRKLDDFFTESNSLLTETIKANAGGDDEKMRAVFSTFARMDDFTTVSDESDSFDVAITKLSQLLGEDVAA